MQEATTVDEKQGKKGYARLFEAIALQAAVIAAVRFSERVRRGGTALDDYAMPAIADTPHAIALWIDHLSRIADNELTMILPEIEVCGARAAGGTVRHDDELYPFDERMEITENVAIRALISGYNEGSLLERAAKATASRGGNTCAVANA